MDDNTGYMFYMAPIFLRQAFLLADELHAIESGRIRLLDETDIVGKASACVILCTSAVEAQATEMFSHIERDKMLTPEMVEMMTQNSTSLVNRINCYRYPFNLKIIDAGKGATQKYLLLNKLRNELVHYKSHYSNNKNSPQNKLERHIKPIFEPSYRFEGSPYFPIAWASPQNAAKAIKIAVDFMVEFSEGLDVSTRIKTYKEFIPGFLIDQNKTNW